ncbi:MAG TPA: hypothetical protein VK448_07040 [Dissulfurispiraceae bacterium]|nr:hypothetical protein [Dissulfurispiraceae bacterium]
MKSLHLKLPVALISLLALFTLSSCSHNLREEFDMSVSKYNNMLSSNELGTASLFAADGVRANYLARAAALKDTRIIDYHIINSAYAEEKQRATVEVEMSYYNLYTYKVKSLRDMQQWIYSEEKGIKGWRINSLLPEFK